MKTKLIAVIIAAAFPLGAIAGGGAGASLGADVGVSGSKSQSSAGVGLSAGLEASGSPGSVPGGDVQGSASMDSASNSFQSGADVRARGTARSDTRGLFRRPPQELNANAQLSANSHTVIVPGSNQPDAAD